MTTARDIANEFLEKGNYRVALQMYLDILQQDSKNANAYQGMAQCYYRLRNYSAAISASLKAIELDQMLAVPHTILANIYYYQNNDVDKSLAEASEAYNLSPSMEEVINCYGALLLANGRLDEGKSVLMQALESNPKSVPIHYNLAVAYNKEHNHKKSLEEMKIVFRYKPTLKHGLQLLLVYEQRYAFLLAALFLITLFGPLFLHIKILLILPLMIVIQGWIIAYSLIRKGKWLDTLLLIFGNAITTMLIYIFYRAR